MVTIERNKKYLMIPVNTDPWSKFAIYPGTVKHIGCGIGPTGAPITGLTEDSEELVDGKKRQVKGTRTIIEEGLGYTKGHLRRGTVDNINPFWSKFAIMIGDIDPENIVTVLDFDTSDLEQYMRALFLAAQPGIALGKDAVNSLSDYCIYNEEEAALAVNASNRIKRKAFAAFEELSPEQLRDYVFLYGYDPASMKDEVVEQFMDSKLNEDPEKFLAFTKSKARQGEVFVQKCLHAHIISKDQFQYKYNDMALGTSITEAAVFLSNPKSAELLMALKTALKE